MAWVIPHTQTQFYSVLADVEDFASLQWYEMPISEHQKSYLLSSKLVLTTKSTDTVSLTDSDTTSESLYSHGRDSKLPPILQSQHLHKSSHQLLAVSPIAAAITPSTQTENFSDGQSPLKERLRSKRSKFITSPETQEETAAPVVYVPSKSGSVASSGREDFKEIDRDSFLHRAGGAASSAQSVTTSAMHFTHEFLDASAEVPCPTFDS